MDQSQKALLQKLEEKKKRVQRRIEIGKELRAIRIQKQQIEQQRLKRNIKVTKCPNCRRTFENLNCSEFKKHYTQLHLYKKCVICINCHKSLSTKDNYLRHRRKQHPPPSPDLGFFIEECDKNITTELRDELRKNYERKIKKHSLFSGIQDGPQPQDGHASMGKEKKEYPRSMHKKTDISNRGNQPEKISAKNRDGDKTPRSYNGSEHTTTSGAGICKSDQSGKTTYEGPDFVRNKRQEGSINEMGRYTLPTEDPQLYNTL